MSLRLAVLRASAPVGAVALGGLGLAAGAAILAVRGFAWPPLLGALAGAGLLASGVVAGGALLRKRFGRTGERERHHRRANIAFFAMGALLLASVTGLALQEIPRFDAPSAVVRGPIAEVSVRQRATKRASYRLSVRVGGAPGRYEWRCGRFSCPPYQSLTTLRLSAGDQVELEVLGDDIIGLTVDGKAYLDPAAERERLRRINGEMIVLCAIGLALLALFGGLVLRRRPVRYAGPDLVHAARAGEAVRRTLGRGGAR